MKEAIIPVFIPHAGCPYQCVFCNQKKISGTIKQPEAQEVMDVVAGYYRADVSKSYELAFYGGSFTALGKEQQKYYLEMAARCREQGLIKAVRFSTRPDAITKDSLDLAWQYGVGTIELGVQSMDDQVLRLSERGHDSGQVKEAAAMIRKRGFRLGLQFMPGLPGDNMSTINNTVAQIIDMQPDFVRIYPAVVIRETKLASQYLAGNFTPFSSEEMIPIVALAYLQLRAAGIRVARMGLQASDNLQPDKDLIAGPYHPAFGELVINHIFYKMISSVITSRGWQNQNLTLEADYRMVSKIMGQKNTTAKQIRSETGAILALKQINASDPEFIKVTGNDQFAEITMLDFALSQKDSFKKSATARE